jgi:hypothetical protein
MNSVSPFASKMGMKHRRKEDTSKSYFQVVLVLHFFFDRCPSASKPIMLEFIIIAQSEILFRIWQ